MQGVKDASGLYEVERRATYAARPGIRIIELQIRPHAKWVAVTRGRGGFTPTNGIPGESRGGSVGSFAPFRARPDHSALPREPD